MGPQAIIAIITAALPLIPIVIKLIEMTIEIIRNIINKHKNKVIALEAKDYLKDIAKNPNIKHININEIGKDAVLIGEVDQNDNVVDLKLYNDADVQIASDLKQNDGVVIYEG